MKNGTEVALNVSSKRINNSSYGSNFPHNLSLTNTQVSRLCKAFVNSSSDYIKLSKTQLHKIR